MQDLRVDLEKMVDEAEWDWLVPHVQRDALVIVASTLNLVDVGVALASDDVSSVQQWIETQQLYKPTPEHLTNWERDRTQRFNALIIQPYVLIQKQES